MFSDIKGANTMRKIVLAALFAAIAAMLALSGSAEAQGTDHQPKTYTCNCACRAESGNEVNIANKVVYSNVPCSSISRQSCSVQVVTKEGSRTVSGTWTCS
jgi:hypothetical protein